MFAKQNVSKPDSPITDRNAARQSTNHPPSDKGPRTSAGDTEPMFASFSFDDDGYPDGIEFVMSAFNSRKNPDGSQVCATFYLKGDNLSRNSPEENARLKRTLRDAIDRGNEIGVHTFSHPHGARFDFTKTPATREDLLSEADWADEIECCAAAIEKPFDARDRANESDYGIGLDRTALAGFRVPYVEYNAALFRALSEAGFRYDASIEEGWQTDRDGRNYFWPYTLDAGSPGDAYAAKTKFALAEPVVGSVPGMWELPVYPAVVPPGELRARMAARREYFDTRDGKITGTDWNLWFDFFMSEEEFLATLKHSFDLRRAGNRCPFILAVHADIYSERYDSEDLTPESARLIRADWRERRKALESFLDYIQSYSDVHIVTMNALVDRMEKSGI